MNNGLIVALFGESLSLSGHYTIDESRKSEIKLGEIELNLKIFKNFSFHGYYIYTKEGSDKGNHHL